jgi:hypothetical protein
LFFKNFRPRMVIEPHIVEGALATGRVTESLETLNYGYEVIDQPGGCFPLIVAQPLVH